MANYRFKTAEIEAMKKNIITQIEHEAETKTAWRLRCAIEGQLMCCRPSKREAARLERELALYESLTKNDLPNWQTEPAQAAQATETPQISTQTKETVNVSAEGKKVAERAENKPYYTHRWRVLHNCDLKTWDKFYKKHKEAILIFHHDTTYTALQKQAVKVSEMCDIAYKVNCHGVEVCLFNDATLAQIIEQGIYVAILELPEAPDYGLTEPPQSPENRPTAADVVQMVKTELAKNKAMGTAWHLEFPDGTECDVRHKCTAAGCDFYEYTEVREGEETFKDYKATGRDITLYICQLLDLDAPQSPETPQVIEYTTDTLKPRETA